MSDTQIAPKKYVTKVTEDGIYGFFEDYRWLSNFHLVDITIDDLTYASTEAAYMSMKCADRDYKIRLSRAKTPGEARRIGRGNFKLVENWDDIRVQVMYLVNKQKYEYPNLRQKLLDTGNKYLEETNTWNDTFWGVCNGVGENNLGKVLMTIREEIVSGKRD